MKVVRYLFGLALLLMVFGVGFSFDYAIECNGTAPTVLVWGEWTKNPNVDIQVLDVNGNIVYEGIPSISKDFDNSDRSGIYYSEVQLDDGGKYIFLVRKGETTESKSIDVFCHSKGLYGKIISVSNDAKGFKIYVNMKNLGNPISTTLKLKYRGGETEKQVNLAKGDNLIVFEVDNFAIMSNTLFVLEYNGGYDFQVYKENKNENGKFTVYAEDFQIRKGDSINYTFKIENEEDYAISYVVSLDTNLNVDVNQFEVELGPHETKEISVTVSADRDFSDVPYFSIIVNGEKYNVKVTLLGAKGFEVTSTLPDSVLEGSIVNAKVTVINIGDFDEKINFYYIVNGQTYNYPYEITLRPGESFTYPVYFAVDKEDVTFEAYVNGEKAYTKNIIVNPIIKQFYAHIENTEFTIYKGESTETNLIIQNTGNVKDVFKIITEGDVTSEVNKIELEPNEIAKIKLTLYGVNYGEHTFNVTVCNDECQTYKLNLLVDMPKEERTTVFADDKVEFVPNETFNYTFIIENNYPLSPITYTVELNGTVIEVLSINSSEAENVTIPITLEENKNYTMTLKVTASDGYQFEKEITFIPVEKNKVPTGGFYLEVGSPRWWALVTLAIVGVGFLGYNIYMKVRNKIKVEKTVVSNEFR